MKKSITCLLTIAFLSLQSNGNCALIVIPSEAIPVEIISSSVREQPLADPSVSQAVQHERVYSKLSFTQKLALKIVQKKAKRAMKKSMSSGNTDQDQPRTLSKLALIFGSVGLGVILIPYVSVVAIPCAIAGIVLGIIGIKKEGSNAMNILGIVFGGALLVILAIVILVLIAIFLV
jgi:hypothetical protein